MEKLNQLADALNKLRVVPRILVFGYGWLMAAVSVWFMGLENPTATQAAFVSTMVGVAAAFFNFYVNTGGHKNVKKERGID